MNKVVKNSVLVFMAAISLSTASAFAQQEKTDSDYLDQNVRCSDDSLNNPQAARRLEWAALRNIIPGDMIQSMIFEIKDGKIFMRQKLQYPLFASWNGNPDDADLWLPESNDFPRELPDDIEWLGICTASSGPTKRY